MAEESSDSSQKLPQETVDGVDLATNSPENTSPESNIQDPESSISPHPHHSKLIKIVGVLALIAVIGSSIFFFLQNQSLKAQMGLPTFKLPWSFTTCSYRGQTYRPGEAVPSGDSCNSCSCGEDGQVACTLMACAEDVSGIPKDPTTVPIAINPDKAGQYNLDSSRLSFSASFKAQDVYVTNCQGSGEGYEFWIYPEDADVRAGICSYEGPPGILFRDIENASAIECWPDDEMYETQKSTNEINGNQVISCKSTLINLQPEGETPYSNEIVSAYILHPADNTAIWVWMQDASLQPIFDQILSTFEFVGGEESLVEQQIRKEIIATLAKPYMLNPNDNPIPGVELLSVSVKDNVVSLDFSSEIASAGRATYEDTLRLINVAIHPIIQGEGINPKNPEMGMNVTIEGNPSDNYF